MGFRYPLVVEIPMILTSRRLFPDTAKLLLWHGGKYHSSAKVKNAKHTEEHGIQFTTAASEPSTYTLGARGFVSLSEERWCYESEWPDRAAKIKTTSTKLFAFLLWEATKCVLVRAALNMRTSKEGKVSSMYIYDSVCTSMICISTWYWFKMSLVSLLFWSLVACESSRLDSIVN